MPRTVLLRLRAVGALACLLITNVALIRNVQAQQPATSIGPSTLKPASSSSFIVAPSLSLGYAPTSLASGQLANSSNLDVVTADYVSGEISVFVGKGNGAFASGVTYAAGAQPSSLTLADLNGDGNLDVVLANESDATVSIFPGNGDGSLGSRSTVAVGFKPYLVAVGDFTGKGHSDIAVAGRSGATLAVLPNDGTGHFGTPLNFALAQAPGAMTAADFNQDGHLDLAFANPDGSVTVWLGTGNGQFRHLTPTATGSGALSAITPADMNRDGKIDLVVTSSTQNSVQVLMGNGDGSFAPGSVLNTGNSPVSSYVADVNGDGIPDLVVVNKGSNTFSVLNGRGDGTFNAAAEFVVGSGPLAAAVGSFYGNAHVDIATIDNVANSLSVPRGNGDGTFGAARSYAAGDQPVAVASADLDGDGTPDLAVANYCNAGGCSSSGGVAILLAGAAGVYDLSAVYAMGAGSVAVALVDVNGDGKPDLISLNRIDKTLSIRLGAVGGEFGALSTTSLSAAPLALTIGDFNGDGKQDVAVLEDCGTTNCTVPGQVEILQGTGSGNFQSAAIHAVGYAPVGIAAGATRNVGATDLVIANRCGADASCKSGGTATILLGDGKGSFANGTSVSLGAGPAGMALANLRGSGVLDLVITRSADNSVAVFPGTGAGTFNAPMTYPVGNVPSALTIADFNGDGRPDVAVANVADSTVSVLYGTGSGTLQSAAPIAVNTNPVALTAISGPAHTAASIATVNGVSSGAASGSRLTVVSNVHARPNVGINTTTMVLTVGPPASTTVNSSTAVALSLSIQGDPATGIPGGGTVTIAGNDTAATVFCTGTLPTATSGSTSTFSCTTSSLNGGVTTLTASYDGDTNYAANSTTASVTVTPLAPTITVLDTPSTQTTVNTSVSFTASLTGVTLTPVAPTGTMTFSLNGNPVSGCSGPVNASGQSTSCSIGNLAAGTNAISAAYTGDPSYVQTTAGSVNHAVAAATPAISVAPSLPSASVNTPVTFTATLTGATFTPVTPNGTITFSLNGTPITTAGCGGTVSASGAAQCTIGNMPAGSNSVTATYSGDTNFVPAAPGSLPYPVSALTPTVAIVPSAASSSVNTAVTFTATLAGAAFTPLAPSGTMTFALNGTPVVTAGCGGAVSASGTSQCTIANMNAGSNTVTATYSGDTNFVPASPGSIPISVSTVSPTFAVVPAPSTAAPITAGSTVTFYAQLGGNPFTPVNPKGTVAFSLNSVAVSTCLTQSAALVSAVWTAQCAIPSLPSGNDNVTAVYSGDTNFIVAAPASYFQNVTQAVPTVSLSSSPATNTFVNRPTSFTAVVAAPAGQTGAPFPSGNVTFKQGTNVLCGGPQGLSVPVLPLSATNQPTATCNNVAFSSASASLPIVAVYSGDTNFSAGTQPTINLTVSPDGTKTTFNTTGSPIVNGTVTFSATVTPTDPGTALPQGTVTFTSNATPAPTGTCSTGVTLTADGSAPTCTLVFGATGAGSITATFNPVTNGNFATSTVTGSLTVGQAGAPLILSSNVAGPAVNQQVMLTAAFTPAITGTLPTGSISFVDAANSQTLCTVSFAQSVTCQPTFASVGPHSITATLAKDQNFAATTSNPVVEGVVQAGTTTNIVAAFANSSVNEQVQFTATVASNVTGTTVPTGSVTFNAALGTQTLVLCGAVKTLTAVAGVPTATCTDSLPANGNWTISATYSGDSNFTTGTSAGITESVGKTAVTLSGIAPTVTSQVNGSVTYTASIASTINGSTVPSGTVAFSDGGTALCGSGVAVSAAGTAGTVTASCAEAFTLAGSHNITVTYSGDGNFAGGLATSVVSVAATPTGVSVSSSSSTSKATQPVIFTAVVTPTPKGATSPTGTVTFTSSDGTLNSSCGAVTVSQRSDGTSIASCQDAFPHNTSLPGQITVSAAYNSDLNSNGVGNFGPNTGAAAQTVQDFTANITVTPTAGSTDPASSKGLILTQGFGTSSSTSPAIAPDPFNAASITVSIASTGSFNDSLNASCSVVSNTTNAAVTDPTCTLSNSTPSGANGTTLTYIVSASAKAPVDSYNVTVTFADPALTTLSQTTAPLKVFVVGQSAALALGTGGATGNEAALFLTPTPFSGTPTISCPQIWDTVNLKVLSNSGSSLITCTGPAGTVSENGLVTTVPISISTNGTSALLSLSGNTLYLAGVFGAPLFALVGLIGGSNSGRKRVLRYLSLVLLAWGFVSVSGCGGSFNRPPPPTASGIPAGNYLVQVVATDSSGNTYFAEVPLVVNAQ